MDQLQRIIRRLALAGFFLLPGATSAAAQSATSVTSAAYLFKPGNIALTLSAGGAAFTDFQQGRARLTDIGSGVQADITRRVTGQTTMTGSAALTMWLSSSFAVRLQGTYVPTRFSVVNEGTEAEGSLGLGDTTRYARLDIWLADGSIVVRPPLDLGRVHPYVTVGGGLARFHVRDDPTLIPPEALDAFGPGDRTQATATVGIGAVIPLQRDRLLLAFQLTDHLIRSPITADPDTFDEEGAVVESRSDDEGGIEVSSIVRLTVGLTIPLRLR
ncbi:MAG TPA: hypothetical protein VF035_00820 [Longimicrobiales bacterium]